MLICHTLPRWMSSRGSGPLGINAGPSKSPERKHSTRWPFSTPKGCHIWTPKWVEISLNVFWAHFLLLCCFIPVIFKCHLSMKGTSPLAHVKEKSPGATKTKETEVKAKERKDARVHNQQTWRTQFVKKCSFFIKTVHFLSMSCQKYAHVHVKKRKHIQKTLLFWCAHDECFFWSTIKVWIWYMHNKRNKILRIQVLFAVPHDLL